MISIDPHSALLDTLPYEVLIKILKRLRGNTLRILSSHSNRITQLTSQESFQSLWLRYSPSSIMTPPSTLLQLHCIRIAKMWEWMPPKALHMYARLTAVCKVEAIRFFLDRGLNLLALELAMHEKERDLAELGPTKTVLNQKGLYYRCLKWRLRDYAIPTSP